MTLGSVEYIAAGGNRHPSAADWASSVLAFGAGNNIALWQPQDEGCRGVTALLAGHSDRVNAIQFWETAARGKLLLSGSADKTIRIWTATEQKASGFEETQCLTQHTAAVNVISVLPDQGLFTSGAADGTVNIWRVEDAGAKLVQSITLKPRFFPLALAAITLSNGYIVLAVAGTSTIIQLYTRGRLGEDFELQATLSGHEGWIRSLHFTREYTATESGVLLASASQDKYIRLWRFRRRHDATASDASDLSAAGAKKTSLSNKAHEVGYGESRCEVTFEALLVGHEDWIYTARWAPVLKENEPAALLSASADNSLSIWNADAASGLWVCSSRLGEISAQKGSTTATGSAGGFWNALWHPQGHTVVSLSRTGSWRQWRYHSTHGLWREYVGISGHIDRVQSLAWSPAGDYLLSTGADQTTRLLAEWRRDCQSSWHEFSRPQIHGYDLNCIDVISPDRFISGADEKLLRVFDKPKAVESLLVQLGGTSASTAEHLPEAASIPVLGLSNKAVPVGDDGDAMKGMEPATIIDSPSTSHPLAHPPLEDQLARHTLWPEQEKLYGHGYEISTVASSHDGSLVATACKASSIDHAVIRIYETKGWREVKPPLTAHSLTVTSLAFSPDDQFLLSVGRDRQWTLFRRATSEYHIYTSYAVNAKGHSRMILDCAWAPAASGYIFATAGRDKTVRIWRVADGTVECVRSVTLPSAVTAIAFCPEAPGGQALLAHGTEHGDIGVAALDAETGFLSPIVSLDAAIAPSMSVNWLRWRPSAAQLPTDEGAPRSLQLAVASDDFSVRIFSLPSSQLEHLSGVSP